MSEDLKKLLSNTQYYTKILSADPTNAEANFELGKISQKMGLIDAALQSYSNAVRHEANNYLYWRGYLNFLISVGLKEEANKVYASASQFKLSENEIKILSDKIRSINGPSPELTLNASPQKLIDAGKFNEAIEVCDFKLKQDPRSIEILQLKAAAKLAQKKYTDAINIFEIATGLEPDNIQAKINLAVSYRKGRDIPAALRLYESIINNHPDNPELHNNLGNLLLEQGNIAKATEHFLQAMALGNIDGNAALQLFKLSIQLSDTELGEKLIRRIDFSELDPVKPNHQNLIILEAISAFMNNKRELACNKCEILRTLTASGTQNYYFNVAFKNFIEALCKYELDDQESNGELFHIGESHCLSFASCKINLDKRLYNIRPVIAFGTKAFHLSSPSPNMYKSIVRSNLNRLPNKSNIFLSFGEIDCRPNEGFIPAANKTATPIDKLITQTVKGYVNWIYEVNRSKGHRIFFMNIPAPVKRSAYDNQTNKLVLDTVRKFNYQLKIEAQTHNFELVDLYNLSSGANGFSNSKFHIDEVHLGPTLVTEIASLLN